MNIKKYGILPDIALRFSLIFLFAGCLGLSNSEKSTQVVMINVLDSDYFTDCHIPGSINIPFEEFENALKTFDKKKHYVTYCSNYACTAAPFAASMLKDAGFEHASFLPGGIVEWYQNGYPCTGPCAKQYLKEANEKLGDDDHMGVQPISSQELKSIIKL